VVACLQFSTASLIAIDHAHTWTKDSLSRLILLRKEVMLAKDNLVHRFIRCLVERSAIHECSQGGKNEPEKI
jgi:hypothetical protein